MAVTGTPDPIRLCGVYPCTVSVGSLFHCFLNSDTLSEFCCFNASLSADDLMGLVFYCLVFLGIFLLFYVFFCDVYNFLCDYATLWKNGCNCYRKTFRVDEQSPWHLAIQFATWQHPALGCGWRFLAVSRTEDVLV